MITVIDYGLGNLASVANALYKLEIPYEISSSPIVVKKAEALILPGVGAAEQGMKNLKKLNLDIVYFWSRSRQKLWMKGEKSGNKLIVKDIFTDCDKDAILIKTKLIGNCVCHTGNKTCFFNNLLKGKI